MMKTKKLFLAVSICSIMLSGCKFFDETTTASSDDDSGSAPLEPSIVITDVAIDPALYPEALAAAYEKNLDFFIDGKGVHATHHVPIDNIDLPAPSSGETSIDTSNELANSTAIGLYLNLLVEMQRNGDVHAADRLNEVLGKLEIAPKWKGLFYWRYDLSSDKWKGEGEVSAVDNGNLSFSLAAVAGAYSDSSDPALLAISERAEQLLNNQKAGWVELYDESKGLLRAVPDATYYVDRKTNESRLAAIWSVLITQDLDTPLPDHVVSNMGAYANTGTNSLLAWDGSYFQIMLPAIFIDEASLVPTAYAQQMANFTQEHMAFADANYGIPFLTASATVDGTEPTYMAYGVNMTSEEYHYAGMEKDKQGPKPTGSPHALALYSMIDEDDAVNRLNALAIECGGEENVLSDYGFYDAIHIKGDGTCEVASKVNDLDQGMFVTAFFADKIQADVQKYLAKIGAVEKLHSLYGSFVINGTLTPPPAH